MPKTISSALAQHLAGEVTTLATCWKIVRRDGVVQGFTDQVCDLEIDGVTYKAASGYTRTAIRSTADLAVENLDVESVFAGDGITEEDLRASKYDFAEARMFLVNYEGPGQGILEEIADALFLASDASTAITGTAIDAFGGINPLFRIG